MRKEVVEITGEYKSHSRASRLYVNQIKVNEKQRDDLNKDYTKTGFFNLISSIWRRIVLYRTVKITIIIEEI